MSIPQFAPPTTPPHQLAEKLRTDGFAIAGASTVAERAQVTQAQLAAFAAEWEDMPVDPYLKDGGHYRRRRHASFRIHEGVCEQVPHRAHFQSPEYNALHGGMMRWFTPMNEAITQAAWWQQLLLSTADVCSQVEGAGDWFIEAHQFRIDTTEGIGRPTPEGAHRDGVDFVALFLVARSSIRGGETRVFDAESPRGLRFTLDEPWTLLLLDDRRVIHESTPIQPLLGEEVTSGHRDTLVLTFRRAGFQEP